MVVFEFLIISVALNTFGGFKVRRKVRSLEEVKGNGVMGSTLYWSLEVQVGENSF